MDVFGHRYRIKLQKDLIENGLHGFCDKRKKIIVLDSKLNAETIHTLVHELIHAVCGRTGLSQAISGETEEIIAENIASVICENFELKFKAKR